MKRDSEGGAEAWRHLVAAGALFAAVAVMAGAFGAHGLRARLDPAALEQWQTASRYLMYAGLGGALAGLMARGGGRRARLAALFLYAGGVIFFLAVAGLALGAPRLLGAVAPIGGFAMIAGFILLAASALTEGPPAG